MRKTDNPMIPREKIKSNQNRFQASSNPKQANKFKNAAFSEPVLQ